MALPKSGIRITRQSIDHMEGMWAKMFDPPTVSPPTPDEVAPTNPVPEVLAIAGYQDMPRTPHTVERDLLHGMNMDTWDNRAGGMNFMLIRDKDNPAASGTFPGPTLRMPRGVIFHGETQGHGPPPHTIHWHGIEPTPMNDGVGHCSMEIAHYTYQWQPNFIGFYFYHCHRNTVQHFEFGLYGALLVDPPDAYFATLWNRAIPIGACRDGKRRIACNLGRIKDLAGNPVTNAFPGFNNSLLTDPDPEKTNPNSIYPDSLKFNTHPHAMTVPYDVEALWVHDDRDSRWSDFAKNARATYPRHGDVPGVNDNFAGNAGGGLGAGDFFSFNDFNADYWYVTGVPVAAAKGGEATIPAGIVIPPGLICGTETQVSIEAKLGQTILVRSLDAAYDCVDVTFPVDVTVIAWDGRALGVPPYGEYNHPYVVPAGTVIHQSVARRFDALIRLDPSDPRYANGFSGFAKVEFIDNEGQVHDQPGYNHVVLCTAKIPINIGFGISGTVVGPNGFGLRGVTVTLSGAASKTAVTDDLGNYRFAGLPNGSYTVTPSLAGFNFTPAGVTIAGADVVQDFTSTQTAGLFAISGLLFQSRGGASIPGATVTLSGTASRTTVTDSQGRYTFTGLAPGSYVVTPTPGEFVFRPVQRSVTISNSNRSASFRGALVPDALVV